VEVWSITLAFKALKGMTHSFPFVCFLTGFYCMALPGALIVFCRDLVKRALEIRVNCQGVSVIYVSFSSHSPELEQTHAEVFLCSFPFLVCGGFIGLTLIILISFPVTGELKWTVCLGLLQVLQLRNATGSPLLEWC